MIKTTDLDTSKRLEAALIGAGYQFRPDYIFMSDSIKSQFEENNMSIVCSTRFESYLALRICGTSKRVSNYELDQCQPSYTMGELWDMLPETIHDDKGDYFELNVVHINPGWNAAYETGNRRDYDIENHHYDNIIIALAELAMWCIDNGHELNCPKRNDQTKPD